MEQKQESKVISLTEMYWQIQKWLDEADMSQVSHSVDVTAHGYEHYKTGKYRLPTINPEISINIHVNGKVMCHLEKSSTIAMEKTRLYIESLKIQKDNKDTVMDVITEI